jgi:hypothetical protein
MADWETPATTTGNATWGAPTSGGGDAWGAGGTTNGEGTSNAFAGDTNGDADEGHAPGACYNCGQTGYVSFP